MTVKTEDTTAPPRDDEDAALAKVEQIIKSLTKLIHGKKLYAENNPRLDQFREEFETSLSSFFKLEDELVLSIDQHEIRWQDKKVYENDKRGDSIAFMMHKDGVGEITIGPGAIGRETEHFARILADEYHNLHPEEDVVTRFWNADFERISYRVLDDYLSADYGNVASDAEPPAEASDHAELLPSLADRGRVIVKQSDPLESIDTYLKRLILRTCKASEDTEREAYFQSMVGSFFTLSNDELTLYQAEIEREKQGDGVADFAETVFVFTLLQDNPSAVRDVSGVLERIADFAVEEVNPDTLTRALTLVRNFQETQSDNEHVQKLCEKVELSLTNRDLVAQLGECLKRWDEEAEGILLYFRVIGQPAIEPLLRVLHHVDGSRLHKEICNVIADIADDIPYVIERLDVDNPVIAVDAVYLANRADLTELTPKLRELLFYPERRVKVEMVALISRIGGGDAVELLLSAVNDEDKMIRSKAMEAVCKHVDPQVRESLGDMAFAKDLADRDPDEQEELFKALGQVGDASTVEQLRQFCEKKGFMQFGKGRENKILAIRALESIHDPASLGLLEELVEDSNSVVQTRARRALEAVKRPVSAVQENKA